MLTPRSLNEFQYFCIFIGYPYSGHTIIGALLDAHQRIVISIEADVLKMMERGYTRRMVIKYIARRSKKFSLKFNGKWNDHSYKVKGQFQGKYDKIRVIGDKKGAETTWQLKRNPNLLLEFESFIGRPLKIIHIVRNPFDNIASIFLHKKAKGEVTSEKYFRNQIEYYFNTVEMNEKIINSEPERVITLYHEDLVERPKKLLSELMDFLEVKADNEYLDACSRIVQNYSNEQRYNVTWEKDFLDQIEANIKKYSFLKRYSNPDVS